MAPTNGAHNRAVAQRITAVIIPAGLVGPVAVVRVRQLLSELRPPLSAETADWLTALAAGGDASETLPVGPGPAQVIEAENGAAWLALYLVAAAERLVAASGTPITLDTAHGAEQRYFELHLRAERRRMRAAALQDTASQLLSDRPDAEAGLLGWRAVMDGRTTPECAWANGRNYRADGMPIIGWPGAVHVHCRCSAGPPVPGAALIPTI